MALGYLFGAVTFAFLCSLVWLALDGSILGAIGVYLLSGQIAMLSLLAAAVWNSRRTE